MRKVATVLSGLAVALAVGLIAGAPVLAHDADAKDHRHYSDDYSSKYNRYSGQSRCNDHEGVYAYGEGNSITIHGLERGFRFGDAEEASLDFRDDDVIIRNYDQGPRRLRITSNLELFVDGERIDLTAPQKKLVGRFYRTAVELRSQAIHIGVEGARIGVRGAALGAVAVASAFKMLVSDTYDEDDLERDLERRAEKLERDAEPLEELADEIEQTQEQLRDLYYQMHREIPEVGETI